ncbi:MAG: DUF2934 domain-containing protein, partial [Chthoniobacterales bacterium]|nr:DUF2934 domain-containing protein [Chthoniobacterales bacterium]
ARKSSKTSESSSSSSTKTSSGKSKSKKSSPTSPTPIQISEEEIRLRAYYIGERRARMGWPGDAHSDWLEAERQLREEAERALQAK